MEKIVIQVVSTGGTIASSPSAKSRGVTPQITGQELVAHIGDLPAHIDVVAENYALKSSGDITYQDLVALAKHINEAPARQISGVVFTQGTDTIEETSFALSLLSRGETPFVVTGAMRSSNFLGADGAANLRDAIITAAEMVGSAVKGAVVFNGEIHDPKFVAKMHTSNLAAFKSLTAGPIGWVSEGRPRLMLAPTQSYRLPHPQKDFEPDVRLIAMSLGDRAVKLSYAFQGQADGFVLDGLGGGHVAKDLADFVKDTAAKVPVVLASRTRAGSVLTNTYGFQGSEIDLISNGVIAAGFLTAPKAKVVLSLLLLSGASHKEIAEAFKQFA